MTLAKPEMIFPNNIWQVPLNIENLRRGPAGPQEQVQYNSEFHLLARLMSQLQF